MWFGTLWCKIKWPILPLWSESILGKCWVMSHNHPHATKKHLRVVLGQGLFSQNKFMFWQLGIQYITCSCFSVLANRGNEVVCSKYLWNKMWNIWLRSFFSVNMFLWCVSHIKYPSQEILGNISGEKINFSAGAFTRFLVFCFDLDQVFVILNTSGFFLCVFKQLLQWKSIMQLQEMQTKSSCLLLGS